MREEISERPSRKGVLKGFSIRPARLDDVEQVVELFNLFSIATIGVRDFTQEEMLNEWKTPGFDLESSTRVVLDKNSKPIGHIEVWDLTTPPVHPYLWGRVHPEFEGRGIGTYLITWAKNRARKALARVPEDHRVSLRASCQSDHAPSKHLLKSQGFQLIRHSFQMIVEFEAPPPEPEVPNAIFIRNYDPDLDREAVFQAEEDAFRDHWGYVKSPREEQFARWVHHNIHDDSYDPSLWFLAMEGDQIVGVVRCREKSYEDPEVGWVRTLSVRKPWRRQGIGLALLQHAFGTLFQLGKKGCGLGVDASSLTGATRLYEKAGMHVQRQYDTYELDLQSGKEISTI